MFSRSRFTAPLVASSALVMIGSAAAFGQGLEFSNDTGGSARFYGQFSPVFESFDDGVESYTDLLDNSHSVSRLGFWIDQQFGENELSFNFETALGLPNTEGWSQDEEDQNWEWEQTDIRKLEFIYRATFGTIWAGQGAMATDGVTESDLSGTTMTSKANSARNTARSFFFRDDETDDLTGVTIGNAFNDFNGSRRFRLRYDTPDFNGFSFAAAYGVNWLDDGDDDDYYDAALRYENTFGDVDVEAAVGYNVQSPDDGGDNISRWIGSVAGLHEPTGLNGMLAFGNQDDGGNYYYLKGGIVREFFNWGDTAFAIDYYSGSDFVTDGSDSENWGIHVNQAVSSQNLQLYAGYRSYSFDDDSGISYADASSFLFGARWRF
jgi:hypothetical protein